MQQQITALERALVEALRQLDALKRAAGHAGGTARVTTLAPVPPAQVLEYDQFVAVVGQALVEHYGDYQDFTDQTFERLFDLAGGDGLTVATFLGQLANRRQARPIESLAGYTVGVIRKVGVDQLRAEQVAKGLVAAPEPAAPAEEAPPAPDGPTDTTPSGGVDELWDEMWGDPRVSKE